jgi:branched-chain amino acid transport system substrate-binding protein
MIGGTASIVTHAGDPWVFRTRPNALNTSRALSTFAVSTLHLTRIALIHLNDAGGMDTDANLRRDLKALGVTPVADESYPYAASDLTAQVLAIKRAGATALISNAAGPDDMLLLAHQMRQVGLHLTWLGNNILASELERQRGGALLYGTYAATDFAAGLSPEAAAFDRAFRAAFHLPGDEVNAYAYDGLNILARVMRRVGSAPQALRAGILAIRDYRGAEGTYNFDRNGDGLHQQIIVQNVQGRLRVIKVLVF